MSPENATTAVTGPGQPGIVQQLHAAATACEDAAAGERFTGDSEVLVWARARLAEVAAACRELAAALGTDPTLATEPVGSPRLRAVDVVVELARQLQWLLRARSRYRRRPAGSVSMGGALGEVAVDLVAVDEMAPLCSP